MTGCRWIEGDVRKDGWYYCGRECVRGESWCPEHRARVYLRPGARQEGGGYEKRRPVVKEREVEVTAAEVPVNKRVLEPGGKVTGKYRPGVKRVRAEGAWALKRSDEILIDEWNAGMPVTKAQRTRILKLRKWAVDGVPARARLLAGGGR